MRGEQPLHHGGWNEKQILITTTMDYGVTVHQFLGILFLCQSM